jgi:hypothetical protein
MYISNSLSSSSFTSTGSGSGSGNNKSGGGVIRVKSESESDSQQDEHSERSSVSDGVGDESRIPRTCRRDNQSSERLPVPSSDQKT